MFKIRTLGIRGRLTLLIVLAVVPVSLLGAAAAVSFLVRGERETQLHSVSEGVMHVTAVLDTWWEAARADTVFLSNSPPVGGIIRARANGGMDPIDGDSIEKWRDRLNRIFIAMAEANGIYDQIRLLDRDGMEVVRVNYKDGRGVRVPKDELQNKKDRHYFTEVAKLAAGGIYISPLDLNQEDGKIEMPHKPTIRFSTPLFDEGGAFQGVVVVNLLFNDILKLALKGHRSSIGNTFIADESGQYIYHGYQRGKVWGGPLNLNTGESVKKDYPTTWPEILDGKQEVVQIGGRHILTCVSRPWPDQRRYLVVGVEIPDSALGKGLPKSLAIMAAAAVGALFFILLIMVGPLSRSVTGPLLALVDSVNRFKDGDMQARAVVVRQDEIGKLSAAFNDMAGHIADQRRILEEKVKERTAKLEEARRAALSVMQDANGQRRRVEQTVAQLQRLTRAIEQSPVSVVITDPEGRIEYANPHFTTVTGYTAAEAVGQNPRILQVKGVYPPDFYDNLWRTIKAGETWRGEFCNKKKSGEIYYESASISPVRNEAGQITHYVAVKEDITGRKRANEELQRAKEAAEAANRAKSTFLANMSHEIRTPMNAILGFSQLMQRDTGLTPGQREHLTTINRAGGHLLALINDVLEMSKIEAGRTTLNPATFDLHGLLDDLGKMFRMRAEHKGLAFELTLARDVPRLVVTDQGKLRQALTNLLGNAVKFTESGVVGVRATARPAPGGARLVFEVHDTGPGISAGEIGNLFKYFSQTSTGAKAEGGTGLGLAISREFALLMGGDITVTSAPGKGSAFRMEIDARIGEAGDLPQAAPARRVKALKPGQPEYRVLVVDDKETNRRLAAEVLGGVGF
ncbi:MAG: PAS domain S-box protein, partial [Deltaproteobacteria bacterium]|nr:PAS domain S-box protein [Deltaproteobacteria bacterium]